VRGSSRFVLSSIHLARARANFVSSAARVSVGQFCGSSWATLRSNSYRATPRSALERTGAHHKRGVIVMDLIEQAGVDQLVRLASICLERDSAGDWPEARLLRVPLATRSVGALNGLRNPAAEPAEA
jgi:hypothetical protein